MRIRGITNLSFLEWLWRGCRESILNQSQYLLSAASEDALPPVSELNGPLTALPAKHKLCPTTLNLCHANEKPFLFQARIQSGNDLDHSHRVF